MSLARSLLLLAAAGLGATALAGCFTPQADLAEFGLSRSYTVVLDPDTAQSIAESESPGDAMKRLLRTDIVVRVAAPGDYTLEYTDNLGTPRSERILGLVPGTPRTVVDVDPLAGAVLKQGDEVKFERKPVARTWWKVGDYPLGVAMEPGAAATYALRMDVGQEASVRDLQLPENVTVDRLTFSAHLPLEGTLSYSLGAAETDGLPLKLHAAYKVPSTGLKLLAVDATGKVQGEPGTAGIEIGVTKAEASTDATMWWREGQPSASRFDGGRFSVEPSVTAWIDGAFAEMGEPNEEDCFGKSRADNCHPADAKPVSEEMNASEIERFSANDFPAASTEEERKVASFLRDLFAQDLAVGDRLQVTTRADSDDLGQEAGSFHYEQDIVMEVADRESVKVAAGTFDALKIVHTVRLESQVSRLGQEGSSLVSGLDLNETITRTTYWLDAKTYQPLKMISEVPVDVDAMVREVLDAIEDDAWREAGVEPFDASKLTLSVTASLSYEATKVTAGTTWSPLVALALAQGLAGSVAAAPAALVSMITPVGSFMSPAEPVPMYEEDAMYYSDGNTTAWDDTPSDYEYESAYENP